MPEKYTFVRNASPTDWRALPRTFAPGDEVLRFHGYTYGLDRDDMVYLGRATVPCYLACDPTTFFTVPVEFLTTENGTPPRSDYA